MGKGFQQRKRINQSVRPPEFAEGTFGFVLIRVYSCPSVVSLNRYKLKLELQRFGQQIAGQWQTTVQRRNSGCSLRFRFRSRFGMKSSAFNGKCSLWRRRRGSLDQAGSISSHAPVSGRCSRGRSGKVEGIGQRRLPERPAIAIARRGRRLFPEPSFAPGRLGWN
jgi:hypothetical protein